MNKSNIILEPGVYDLPNNCKAFSRGGKVIVSLKRKVTEQCNRCRTCKHFGNGYISASGTYTSVCFNRPKHLKWVRWGVPNDQIYYSAYATDKACESYEPKEPFNGNENK